MRLRTMVATVVVMCMCLLTVPLFSGAGPPGEQGSSSFLLMNATTIPAIGGDQVIQASICDSRTLTMNASARLENSLDSDHYIQNHDEAKMRQLNSRVPSCFRPFRC